MHQVLQFGPSGLLGLLLLIVFVAVGLIIIVFVIKAVLFLLPAAIVALIVWFITGSHLLTGLAFLLIAAISIARR